jgi:hypothetical protein
MMKLIPLLTNDENFSFDVIIPSVIGFGFLIKLPSQVVAVRLLLISGIS